MSSVHFGNVMKNWKKRTFDIVFSLLGVVLALPLFLIISILILMDSPGRILFRQRRVGQDGKLFNILKFRTMSHSDKGSLLTLAEDDRITKVGRFLRKTKLDELPQLLNVLKGDMSFVGPRPEVPYFVAKYTDSQREILKAKPGITDLASIEYRDESELFSEDVDAESFYVEQIMPKKIELNKEYLKNMSLKTDVGIILKTLKVIIGGLR